MSKNIFWACAPLVLAATLPAQGAETDAPPPTPYQNVMRAQYAARTVPLPARPEEAQRIYDAYLRSIGQPVKDQSMDSGGNAGMPSR